MTGICAPAYSFILAAGGMVAVVKRGAGPEAVPGTAPCPEVASDVSGEVDKAVSPETVAVMDKTPARSMDNRPSKVDKPHGGTAARRPAAGADKAALDKAAEVLRSNPGITNAEAARRANVSAKTVQRARPLAAAPADPQARSEP